MKMQRKSILIIEDHKNLRILLGSMLSKDYEVVTKKDGLEGMVWLGKGNIPDLILMDMCMPRLNGTEFLKGIRNSGFFKNIPVIILSANDSEEEINFCLEMGVEEYFKKPFNPILLTKKISMIFNATLQMAS